MSPGKGVEDQTPFLRDEEENRGPKDRSRGNHEPAGRGQRNRDEKEHDHQVSEERETGAESVNVSDLLALYGMETDLRTYSPLALAFLGDAVYSLIIRTSVVAKGNRQAEKLHNETTRLVRAQKQAAVGRVIYDLLTVEEQKVYRRGRNSHPMHHAKGASLEEYLQATALETLCGWLYLQGRTERLMELIRTGLELTARRNGEPLL